MKKFLLLLSILLPVALFCGCTAMGGDNGGGEEGDNPNLTIPHDIIAGSEISVTGYVPDEYVDNGYEIFFGDISMITIAHKEPFPLIFKVPENMQGQYTVSVRSGKYKADVAGVSVFKYTGECLPGTAYRADLSFAHSIYCTSNDISGELSGLEYKTKKFTEGNPSDVKFYNIKGREVPASFTYIKDISEDFFYARMSNARTNDGILFDYENFTCNANSNYDEIPVVVDKKTGTIVVLNKRDEGEPYMNSYISFQWMGDRKFCFLPESYSAEFSSKKLYKFDIPEFYISEKDEIVEDENFCYYATIEKLPGQDNLDILNGYDNHWVAASEYRVLYNNERMLSGSLVSIEKPNPDLYFRSKQVFCNYQDGGLYYLSKTRETGCPAYTKVNALSGSGSLSHMEEGCECTYDIYQYADHTYLRAETMIAGSDIHDITMSDNITVTKTNVDQIEEKIYFFEPAVVRYPFFSNYDYGGTDNGIKLIRRKVSERNQDKPIYNLQGNELFTVYASSSRNALTFSVMLPSNGNDDQFRIISTDTSGNISNTIELPSGTQLHGISRLQD